MADAEARKEVTVASDMKQLLVQGYDGTQGGENQTDAFDTNAEILPANRKKCSAVGKEDEEEKKMSKAKRRKLEQLAQKKASRELRSSVLQELKSVQLSAEQVAMMQASQSTRLSRRDQVAIAKRRLELGLPLTDEMKKLGRRRHARSGGDAGADEGSEGGCDDAIAAAVPAGAVASSSSASSSTRPATRHDVRVASVPAPVKQTASAQPAATAPPQPRKDAVAFATAAATATNDSQSTKATASPSAAVVAPAREEAVPKTSAPQPLKPERVERTAVIEDQRAKLPAVMLEQEVVETVLENDVILVCGDTGCGKSTQVPQFLYEAGLCDGDKYKIAVTQPRRVAAISVSQRVGQELNDPTLVGYQVRYDKSHCGPSMRIKFMTDGILLREVQADFLCRKYSVIVIDEAHERGVNCDILIGLLSRAVLRRRRDFDEAIAKGVTAPPPLRLVIMSATLRLCDFTENRQLFPVPPPVVRIDARTYPVTVHFARHTDSDYIKAAHKSVLEIHKKLPPGTILVFVTGKQEVHRLCKMLRKSMARKSCGLDEEESAIPAEEEDAAEEGAELLEASDDEGNAFDDDLGEGTAPVKKVDSEGPSRESEAAPIGKKRKAARGGLEVGTLGEDTAPGRRKKKRKVSKKAESAVTGADAEEDNPEAEAPAVAEVRKEGPRRKKVRKAKRKVSQAPARPEKMADATPEDVNKEAKAGKVNETAKEAGEKTEEVEVSFRLDAEEDVVVLDPEVAAEDAKDAEAKRQKRVAMGKLDKSRTADGRFHGLGFGEGPLLVLPLYAQLAAREQLAPFAAPPEDRRVVVVSTNVAETSVTLPNVRYVVDTGREKRRKYKASSGVSAFEIETISKASADQRAGRAGRLGPGHTYRLYSAAAFENYFTQFAPIAMLHTPMDPVLLLIASLGVPRLDIFPWPTPPSAEAVQSAIRRLRAIGAIQEADRNKAWDETGSAIAVKCTALGYRLSTIPVAPRYAKMLLAAVSASKDTVSHIIGHACALVAALSVGNLTCHESASVEPDDAEPSGAGPQEHELERARREAAKRLLEAQRKEAPRWSTLRDEAEGLLWLMGGYAWSFQKGGPEDAEKFCNANKVNHRQIAEAHSLMQQLGSLLQRRLQQGLEALGLELELPLLPKPPTARQTQKLRECLVEGLIDRLAVSNPDLGRHAYNCADLGHERPVFVHNSSNVFRHRPQPSMLVFNDIISTSRPFMRDCVSVDPMMLAKLASSGTCPLLKVGEFLAVPAPRYLKEQDRVVAFSSPTYAPLSHTLPTLEVDVPADNIFRCKVFAKALLDGEVLKGFPPGNAQLRAKSTLLLHAPNNPRVAAILGPLFERRVGSRAELLQQWEENRHFLLSGYLKWLPNSQHDDAQASWPPRERA